MKVKIKFAEGCFDQFEGSQEELNDLMSEIVNMFENITPEDLEKAREVSLDELDIIDQPRILH